ncbi:MAG: 4Fe-4S dicluster domain-containing protein [Actinomycetaceae bacterium]|nr:4Fe-4S dicluster domain-containing protein [Actinomycetaceae bacterium]
MSGLLEKLPARLSVNMYETDDGNSHIELHQEYLSQHQDVADMLVRVCPAHVYRYGSNGVLEAEFAACLECGTCAMLAPAEALTWHYPEGGMGIVYREG